MSDDTETTGSWTGVPEPEGPPPQARQPRPGLVRRRVAGAATVTGLVAGGLLGGYVISHAAASVASPSATPDPSGGAPGYGDHDGRGGWPGGPRPGGRAEDLQVAAKAIGISAADLKTALRNGQTIAAVAKAHNVDVNTVISALVSSENSEIDSALSAGRITQAQATQMKSTTQQRVTDMVNGVRPPGGPGHMRGLQGEDLTLVAGAIGISTADLQTALQNGQTIAAVAKAHNVDVNTVINAWVASENKEIDDRASSGQITQAQATQLKSMTQQRITDAVNGTRPAGGDHRGGFGRPDNDGTSGISGGGAPAGVGPSV